MKYMKQILLFALLVFLGTKSGYAQDDRTFIRLGNRAFKAEKWVEAETQYRKAISKNGKNAQAVYNLGCTLMRQQKDSLAMQQFANAAKLESSKVRRAKSYHNMGVMLQMHRMYAEAIEAYKMALRNNPGDEETRYNLALCKKLLKNQPPQNNQNKNDKNNKDKNNKDKNNKNQQDKNKNDKDNKDNKDKNDKNNKDQQRQDQEKMSKDNAEQLLNAAVQQEKATKQKLQKAMSQPRRKRLEKNW